MLIAIKMKKNISELGHVDRLKIYVSPSKIHVNPGMREGKTCNPHPR